MHSPGPVAINMAVNLFYAAYPGVETDRVGRAVAILRGATPADVLFYDDGTLTVNSKNQAGEAVRYETRQGVCTCPDSVHRPTHVCKHRILRTLLLVAAYFQAVLVGDVAEVTRLHPVVAHHLAKAETVSALASQGVPHAV